jgi:hypothetical protein
MSNQHRVCAAALAALLHLALISTLLMPRLQTRDFGLVPEQALQLVYLEHQDTEQDKDIARERPAAPLARPHKEADAAAAPPPAPLARNGSNNNETTLSDDQVRSELPPLETSTAITAMEASIHDALMNASHPKPVEIAIPAAQRVMLARRIVEWARGLQGKDLTQAHLSWQDAGQQYEAVLTRRPAANSMDIESDVVQIATEKAGVRLQTQLQMKRLAFSHFTQFVDRWDDEVQLHDDEVAGRFHSNSAIFVGYDRDVAPRFLGKVTTAARGIVIASPSRRRPRTEIFRAGLETRTPRIALPERFLPFAADQDVEGDSAGIEFFSHDARITFYSDGSYGWQALGSNASEQRRAPSPVYIVAARKKTLYVRGVVRGTMLVYSPERIVIEGDLIYAHDPRSTPGANDYLGLVSDNHVEIAPPVVTGPGDLEIHAAIYAKRRFIVTNEYVPEDATLLIYGSLTAGSLSATEPRYATKIEFDPRFERIRPPGFPMTDRYEIDAWNAQWQVQ